MELLRRQGGSLGLGKREPLERYAEALGVGWAGEMRRVPTGVGWWGQGISSTSSSEPFRKKMKLISSINGKSLTGRSQRITSSSNPSRKHAPRAVSCQLIRLEIARNSSTYLSNLRPLCRNPHSASSAEVILWSSILSRCTGVPGTRRRGTTFKDFNFQTQNRDRWRTGTHTKEMTLILDTDAGKHRVLKGGTKLGNWTYRAGD